MGDIICMSSEFMTIGSSKDKHNLSGLNEPLRSHGGLHEREVPFIVKETNIGPITAPIPTRIAKEELAATISSGFKKSLTCATAKEYIGKQTAE